MHINCPYCQSAQVHRVFVSHPPRHKENFHHYGSLAAKFGLGRAVIKNLSGSRGLTPSPWMAGLAEVLLKSLLHYLLESQRPYSDSELSIRFYCEQCHRSFHS